MCCEGKAEWVLWGSGGAVFNRGQAASFFLDREVLSGKRAFGKRPEWSSGDELGIPQEECSKQEGQWAPGLQQARLQWGAVGSQSGWEPARAGASETWATSVSGRGRRAAQRASLLLCPSSHLYSEITFEIIPFHDHPPSYWLWRR